MAEVQRAKLELKQLQLAIFWKYCTTYLKQYFSIIPLFSKISSENANIKKMRKLVGNRKKSIKAFKKIFLYWCCISFYTFTIYILIVFHYVFLIIYPRKFSPKIRRYHQHFRKTIINMNPFFCLNKTIKARNQVSLAKTSCLICIPVITNYYHITTSYQSLSHNCVILSHYLCPTQSKSIVFSNYK